MNATRVTRVFEREGLNMADFTDPNNWTKEYVRSHRKECLSYLKETNLLVIRYVRQNNYEACITGLDRILNGLMTMQNSKCGDYWSIMSMFSMAEGVLLTFLGPRGVPVAIDMLKDAKDFARKPETKKEVDAILAPLQAGESLDAEPSDVVWLLQKMDHQLDVAISGSGASPSRSVSSPSRSVSPPASGPVDRKFEAWVEDNGWDEEDLERYYKKIRFRRNLYGLCLLGGPLGVLILPFWLRAVYLTKSIRHRTFSVKTSWIVYLVTMLFGLPTLYIYPWIMGKIIVATNWGMGMGDRRAWIPIIAIIVMIAGIVLAPAIAHTRSDNSAGSGTGTTSAPTNSEMLSDTGTNPTPADPETLSGTCGDNLTWTLKNGVLTIDGTGPMYDYMHPQDGEAQPWFDFGYPIYTVVIGNDVTSIGNYAFSQFDNLTSVIIPDSVTSIGGHAFSWCTSLASVSIPSNVTFIDTGAFYFCDSLTSINVASRNPSYVSVDGVLFSADQTLLHTYPSGKADISYSIPVSVTSIGNYAFYGCSSLTSVTIPDSVTSIGGEAFMSCSNLTGVTIPEGVTSIGDNAFYGCSSLTNVTIPGSVTSIGSWVFMNCSNLASVTIQKGVTSIGGWAFYGCSSLTSVTIPESVTFIGGAFTDCSSLTSVVIPSSVTTIKGSTFDGCSSLTSVTIPSSVTSIEQYAFSGCGSLKDVYYGGSENQWSQISIETFMDGNAPLLNAEIHFNS